MNIKDLPQGSYTPVTSQPTTTPKLNLKNLPQDSYKFVESGVKPQVGYQEGNIVQDLAKAVVDLPTKIGSSVSKAMLPKVLEPAALQGTSVPSIFGGKDVNLVGYRDGKKLEGLDLAKDIAGTALEGASYMPITGGVSSVVKGVGGVGPKIGKLAKDFGIAGALQGSGSAYQEGKTTGEALSQGLTTGAISTAAGPVIGKGAELVGRAGANIVKKVTDPIKYYTDSAKSNALKAVNVIGGVKPADMSKIKDKAYRALSVIKKVNPEIKRGEIDVPLDIKNSDTPYLDVNDALVQTRKRVYEGIRDAYKEATGQGLTINPGVLLEDLRGIYNNPANAIEKRTKAQAIRDELLGMTDRDGNIPIENIETYTPQLNERARPGFGASSALGAKMDKDFAIKLSDFVDDAVEKIGLPQLRTLKDDYSSLKAIEKYILNEAKKEARRLDTGLAANIGDVGSAEILSGIVNAFRATTGDPQAAASLAKGVALKAFSKMRQAAGDRANYLRKAFDDIDEITRQGAKAAPIVAPVPEVKKKVDSPSILDTLKKSMRSPRGMVDLNAEIFPKKPAALKNPLLEEAKKYKSAEEFVKDLKGVELTTRNGSKVTIDSVEDGYVVLKDESGTDYVDLSVAQKMLDEQKNIPKVLEDNATFASEQAKIKEREVANELKTKNEKVNSKNLMGYERTLSPLQSGKVADVLDKKIKTSDMGTVSKKDFILKRIITDGKEVSNTGILRTKGEDAGYALNKIEQKYAEWVSENKAQLTDIWNKAKGTTKTTLPVYKGETDLTTKILKSLEGKSTVSKQFILDATNRGELKQVERDLIRKLVQDEPNTVDVTKFANKVKAELLPLKRNPQGNAYENVTLPDELRGSVKDYSSHVYESPIKTSAGNVHFSQAGGHSPDAYFGHTRIEDMADNSTRRVIEVQSDLYQKGGLAREIPELSEVEKAAMEGKKTINVDGVERGTFMEHSQEQAKQKMARQKEASKLQQYNDPTAHFRMIREEIKKAAEDGKTKLQFPTGETAMKIEGLGSQDNWSIMPDSQIRSSDAAKLTKDNLEVGKEVYLTNDAGDNWIITDVLGDGKFKAVPKDRYEAINAPDYYGDKSIPDNIKEQFDISGKVDTNNPIYKFYNKEVRNYLNKFGGKEVKDDKGVSWIEIPIGKNSKGAVEAFGLLGAVGLGAAASGGEKAKAEGSAQTMPLLGNMPEEKQEAFLKKDENLLKGIYHPRGGVTVTEKDLSELEAILFGEISNRPLSKKMNEIRDIVNVALNRVENEGKTLKEVLQADNQFQAFKGKLYEMYKSGKAGQSVIEKEKVNAVRKVVDELRRGKFANTVGDNLSYAHLKDDTLRLYKDWSEQKKDLKNIK